MLYTGKRRIYIVAGHVGYGRREAPGPPIVTLWGGGREARPSVGGPLW